MIGAPLPWTPRHEADQRVWALSQRSGRPASGDAIRAEMERYRAVAAELAREAHAADERERREQVGR